VTLDNPAVPSSPVEGNSTDSTDSTDTAAEAPLVRLRHEAGLTAGRAMPLGSGAFQFGPLRTETDGLGAGEPEVVSFELVVEAPDRTSVLRGTEPVAVDGVLVTGAVAVKPGEVIQLSTDHFTVERLAVTSDQADPVRTASPDTAEAKIRVSSVRPPSVPDRRKLIQLFGLTVIFGVALGFLNPWLFALIAVGVLGLGFTMLRRHRRRAAATRDRKTDEAKAATHLGAELQRARTTASQELRARLPGPADITDLVTSPKLATSAFDGQLAVASGDLGWEPPIEDRGNPGWDYEAVVRRHDFLAAVPFAIDVYSGPVGIVGPRHAALASARHIVSAAMALNHPDQLSVELITNPENRDDWVWLDGAPHLRPSGQESTEFALRLFDGGPGNRQASNAVIVAESIDELEAECTTLLVIRSNGTAFAHLGEGVTATGLVPHGVTVKHAARLVSAMAENTDQLGMVSNDHPTPDHTTQDDVVIDLRETPGEAVLDLRLIPTAPDSSAPQQPRLPETDMLPTSYLFRASRYFVVGTPGPEVTAFVAAAAIRQATTHPNRPIYVLDRGDRALIRLAQLPSCRQYVAIDDLPAVRRLLDDIEEFMASQGSEETPPLLVAADLQYVLDFYRRCGQPTLVSRLQNVLRASSAVNLASSLPSDHSEGLERLTDEDMAVIYPPGKNPVPGEGVRMIDSKGQHQVDDSAMPSRDMTDSVAQIKWRRQREHAGSVK